MTENGGNTWKKVLFIDENTGIIDMVQNRWLTKDTILERLSSWQLSSALLSTLGNADSRAGLLRLLRGALAIFLNLLHSRGHRSPKPRDLGLDPLRIETPEGRQEYAAAQRGFADRAAADLGRAAPADAVEEQAVLSSEEGGVGDECRSVWSR